MKTCQHDVIIKIAFFSCAKVNNSRLLLLEKQSHTGIMASVSDVSLPSKLGTTPIPQASKMTQSGESLFPRLGTASCECLQINKEYTSGASYSGQVKNNKKAGRGLFIWPNGAKYDGEFVDNVRHGKGIQEWPCGSRFEGMFVEDTRQGHGQHSWANGESYEGIFYKDCRHGSGKYTWADGSSYSGMFFMDHKEGYGTLTFADGRKFQGLYKCDEREGPGVMTYPDGKQDVGLWHRDHIAKLCTDVSTAFTMKNHPEFDYFPEEHQVFIKPDSIANRTDIIANIVSPPEAFQYEPKVDISEKSSEIFQDGLHSEALAADLKSATEELQKSGTDIVNLDTKTPPQSAKSNRSLADAPEPSENISEGDAQKELDKNEDHPPSPTSSAKSKRSKSSKSATRRKSGKRTNSAKSVLLDPETETEKGILAWNTTPASIEMQKHVIKHSVNQLRAGFNVDNILNGNREGFAERGPLEEAAERLILAAAEGNVKEVANLVNAEMVAVDVADKSGYTALLAAAVNWHQDVINCLLDNGADINRLNDEGVSSLAACHVFFYPIDTFRYNIAERYLEKPVEMDTEPSYDVNEAVKGILTTSQKKRPHPTIEKKQNTIDTKKIQKLKEEFGGIREKTTENPAESENKENTKMEFESPKETHAEPNRKLGTLQVKRSVRINIEEMLAPEPIMSDKPPRRKRPVFDEDDSEFESQSDVTTEIEDFDSAHSARNYPIDVSDQLIDRCATGFSANQMIVSRARSANADPKTIGTVRKLAMEKSHHQLMESTIRLLLRRGADPNASQVPMPVLFFAIKAADVEAVKILLMKGASTRTTLSEKKGGLAPLHIAVAIPGEEGVEITSLLLDALADPDARATEDDSFLNRNLQEEWSKDPIDEASQEILGGRTPLHIACARDDNYKNACSVVHLLLDHHANPNHLCNGNSPLALSIRSGNDLAIDELLAYHADPCLPLTHGVGSALCVASSTEYEHRRTPDGRIALIDKLIAAGADILAPILIGPKRLTGTSVDYSYYMYNLDRRIAHMPYHALSPAERDTFNARRRLLGHLGDILRQKATEREKLRLEEEDRMGRRSRSPSPNFVYTGAGAQIPPGIMKNRLRGLDSSRVNFSQDGDISFAPRKHARIARSPVRNSCLPIRKPMLRYCYECGRSVGVRLAACTRCKEVYYCSKACKLKAWNARHKEECVRIGGHSPSTAHRDKRIDSPTPATDPDKGKSHTVKGINNTDPRIKDTYSLGGHNVKSTHNGQNLHYHALSAKNKVNGQVHSYPNYPGQERFDERHSAKNRRGRKTAWGENTTIPGQGKGHGQRLGLDKVHGQRSGLDIGQGHGALVYVPGYGSIMAGKLGSQRGSKVPIKGRSLSATKMAVKGPMTLELPNGKIIYIDNYSYV